MKAAMIDERLGITSNPQHAPIAFYTDVCISLSEEQITDVRIITGWAQQSRNFYIEVKL